MPYLCWVLIVGLVTPLASLQTLYPKQALSQLHSALDALQHPANCTSAKVLVVQYSAESSVNGFAAMFQFIAGALSVAFALNRTLIEAFSPTDPWLRSPPQYCGGLKLGCYLEPISSCAGVGWDIATVPTIATTLEGALTQDSLPALRLSHLGTHHDLLFQATGGGHWPQWWDDGVGEHGCVYQGVPWGGGLRVEGAEEGGHSSVCPRRLWFPAIQSYLFKPLPRILQGRVGEALAVIDRERGAGREVFGVHVRRGDAAALGWRSNAGVEEYGAVADIAAAGIFRRRGRRRNGSGEGVIGVFGTGEEEGQGVDLFKDTRGGGGGGMTSSFAAPPQHPILVFMATDCSDTRARGGVAFPPQHFTLFASASAILDTPTPLHTESVIAHALAASTTAASSSGGSSSIGSDGRGTAVAVEHPYLPPPHPLPQRMLLDELGPPDSPAVKARGGDLEGYFASYAAGTAGQGEGGGRSGSAAAAARTAHSVAQLTEGVIGDIWVLAHATHFIGTCLSQVSRVAFDLAYARGEARAPPVGLDTKACREHPRHFFPITADWREGFDEWRDG